MKLIQEIASVVRHAGVPRCWLGLMIVLLLSANAFCASAKHEQTAKQILDAVGIQGGLIVHLDCGDASCLLECGLPGDSCTGTILNCGSGECTATCNGMPKPQVNGCMGSCDCTTC